METHDQANIRRIQAAEHIVAQRTMESPTQAHVRREANNRNMATL